jgi:saccharopine dehydrogenase-like NADP-dependent oxidoreductase
MKITVLGCGMVGAAIVRDLKGDEGVAVTAVDASPVALGAVASPGVRTVPADLRDPAEADLVVGAVPGFMGFRTLQAVIEAGKNVVDISFFPEDPLALDELARDHGVTALVDCGIAPGCSNLIAGRAASFLDRFDRFVCYVGGLPVVRTWPWEYKAVFSPSDVLEEYVRPARYIAHGVQRTMPALSEPELIDLPGAGTLEAFNTDGLRTLLATGGAPFMIEKTLRYPGHIDKIRVLRESGFFSTAEVKVGDVAVRPLELTSRLLFPVWKLQPGEEDFTVMRVTVEGLRGARAIRTRYDLLDRFDRTTGTSSMARTTGYTCTAVVRTFIRGMIEQKGVLPLELVGRDPAAFDFILADLERHNVVFQIAEEPVED